MALTVKELRAAKPGEWLTDGPAGSGRGSGVLVFRRTDSGAQVAYFRYTLPNGKRDALPVGQYDEAGRDGMTLAEARTRAGELSRLYQSGVRDVRAYLERERATAEAAIRAEEAARQQVAKEAQHRELFTLRALCDAYLRMLERAGKTKSAGSARSLFRCHVGDEVGNLPAKDITPKQIAGLVRKPREAGKDRAAGALRSYLSAAFNAAKRAPFDSSIPAELIDFNVEHNPVDPIPAIAVRRGMRSLKSNELRAYIGHILRVGEANVTGPEAVDSALQVALLAGGQRMAQLLRATVGDFNSETGLLRLLDGKGRRIQAREHLLPLGPRAATLVSLLVDRARRREQERAEREGREPDMSGQWIFSTHGSVPIAEETPSKRVKAISMRMGGEPFTLRDIRRTVETMLAGLGVSKDVRAQLLSHGLSGVQTANYDRHTYMEEKRGALIAWESKISFVIGATPDQAH